MPASPAPSLRAPGMRRVAYFSMEVALDDGLPIFSGGLGVLAGDFLSSAADLDLPIIAVTLAYREGYFRQHVDARGVQREEPVAWSPAERLERLPVEVALELGGKTVHVGAWRTEITGERGIVPLLLLDTDLLANSAHDRAVTDRLYGGDERHRLEQEAVLGIGGVLILRALGYTELDCWHMNEGHAALLGLRLLEEAEEGGEPPEGALTDLRGRTVFTTHTPVPAGHDCFPRALVAKVLGPARTARLNALGLLSGGELNLTELGMACSAFVNGVSLRHRAVTAAMFPGTQVTSITNGVHVARWAAPSTVALFDEHIPGWRRDASLLRYASGLPVEAVAAAHRRAKAALLDHVGQVTGRALDPGALTLGVARRATPYKRTDLLFADPARLRAIAERHGPIQVLLAGKAHPRDVEGKALIRRIVRAGASLGAALPVLYLEEYDLELARLLVAGSDCWLNTPQPPHEASGTSGMKAALNGVPSLSVLDGWWLEGCVEGVTGWAIGADGGTKKLAPALYDVLDEVVAPCFFADPLAFAAVRRGAIALNGSFFNTERMVREYATAAYGWPPG